MRVGILVVIVGEGGGGGRSHAKNVKFGILSKQSTQFFLMQWHCTSSFTLCLVLFEIYYVLCNFVIAFFLKWRVLNIKRGVELIFHQKFTIRSGKF